MAKEQLYNQWTHEMYVEWLADNRPDLTAIETYVRNGVKIGHRCDAGHRWDVTPNKVKQGKSCPKCNKTGKYMARVTPEEYEQWLAENRPELTALEPYINSLTPIMHQCSRGHEPWRAAPSAIRHSGSGCPSCDAEKRGRRVYGSVTLETIKASATQFGFIKDWRAAHPIDYSIAHKRGWLDQCTAHMAECRRPDGWWTLERCKASALEFETISDWSREAGSAYNRAHKNGWLSDCTSHMERTNGHDNDAVYLWEWVEDGKGTGIYKPGLTSWRLADKRIRDCAHINGIDYRLIALCQTSEKDAKAFESVLLGMGDEVALPDHITDGRTEFRIYSESELALIYQLLGVEEAQAEAA